MSRIRVRVLALFFTTGKCTKCMFRQSTGLDLSLLTGALSPQEMVGEEDTEVRTLPFLCVYIVRVPHSSPHNRVRTRLYGSFSFLNLNTLRSPIFRAHAPANPAVAV